MSKKIRADQWLVDQGLVESRTKAQALILAGNVYRSNKRVEKPSEFVQEGDALMLKGMPDHPWVSRGGMKLDHGLKHFGFSTKDIIALDIGASTGGFTDVLLHYGAVRVYAVDVGYGQLAWKIQEDARVVVMDKTNARYLTPEMVPEPVDALVCDASFISLTKVLPAAMQLVKSGGWMIALIKPQFEVGKGQVGKGGIVREEILHTKVCEDIKSWLINEMKWNFVGITPSPIKGQEGNIEFLIGAIR